MSCARVVIFGSLFFLDFLFFYFLILEFRFPFFIVSTRQNSLFPLVIEEISSNDDAFPTYIHAWDWASCRQNLLSTYT